MSTRRNEKDNTQTSRVRNVLIKGQPNFHLMNYSKKRKEKGIRDHLVVFPDFSESTNKSTGEICTENPEFKGYQAFVLTPKPLHSAVVRFLCDPTMTKAELIHSLNEELEVEPFNIEQVNLNLDVLVDRLEVLVDLTAKAQGRARWIKLSNFLIRPTDIKEEGIEARLIISLKKAIRMTSILALEGLAGQRTTADENESAQALKDLYSLAWGGTEENMNQGAQVVVQKQYQLLHGYSGPMVQWNPTNGRKAFGLEDLDLDRPRRNTLEYIINQIKKSPKYGLIENRVKNQLDHFVKQVLETFLIISIGDYKPQKVLERLPDGSSRWNRGLGNSLMLNWAHLSKKKFGKANFKGAIKRSRQTKSSFWNEVFKKRRIQDEFDDIPNLEEIPQTSLERTPGPPGPPAPPGQTEESGQPGTQGSQEEVEPTTNQGKYL